jgi:putative aminopeptidase FrvX
MRLLQRLTEANGVSGYEHEVRHLMQEELKQLDVPVVTDGLGSIFGEKRGLSDNPRILLAGHLDEVGFMVTEITKNGYLRFSPLGGWWSQVLLSQRVTVTTERRKFTGVIGSKALHLLTPEERNKTLPIREMYIDVGAKSDEQIKEWGICIGDPIVPICPFEILPDQDTVLAKALDNRMGCYLALEVLRRLQVEEHPNTVVAGATVQEEVGLRGALTSVNLIEPDVAFALDVGIAEDAPGQEALTRPKMGQGPLITFLDASMIPNIGLRNLVVETAKEHNIPTQLETMTGGGTDAGRFHVFGRGVPSLVVGVAARYIHSHVSMLSIQDMEYAIELLVLVIKKLDKPKIAEFTSFL